MPLFPLRAKTKSFWCPLSRRLASHTAKKPRFGAPRLDRACKMAIFGDDAGLSELWDKLFRSRGPVSKCDCPDCDLPCVFSVNASDVRNPPTLSFPRNEGEAHWLWLGIGTLRGQFWTRALPLLIENPRERKSTGVAFPVKVRPQALFAR